MYKLILLLLLSCSAFAAGNNQNKVEYLGELKYLKVDKILSANKSLLKVQVELSNTSIDNQQLYYRFKWYDSDGFTVWNDEPWKTLLIYGKQRSTLSAVAPTKKATDYKIELQSPENRNNDKSNASPLTGN
ncbi:MAG: YcfL family protein [Pseudomonadota bacterium]